MRQQGTICRCDRTKCYDLEILGPIALKESK